MATRYHFLGRVVAIANALKNIHALSVSAVRTVAHVEIFPVSALQTKNMYCSDSICWTQVAGEEITKK